jgi:hypothetical protein
VKDDLATEYLPAEVCRAIDDQQASFEDADSIAQPVGLIQVMRG